MSALPGLAFGLEPACAGNVVGRLKERSDGAGIWSKMRPAIGKPAQGAMETELASRAALPAPAFGLEPAYAGNVVGRLKERSDGAGIWGKMRPAIGKPAQGAMETELASRAALPAPAFGLEPACAPVGAAHGRDRRSQ